MYLLADFVFRKNPKRQEEQLRGYSFGLASEARSKLLTNYRTDY